MSTKTAKPPAKKGKAKGRRILIWEPFFFFWKPSKEVLARYGTEHRARYEYGLLSQRVFILLTILSIIFLFALFVSKFFLIGLLLSSGLAIKAGHVHTQKPGSAIPKYYRINIILLLCHIFLAGLAAYTIQNILRGRF